MARNDGASLLLEPSLDDAAAQAVTGSDQLRLDLLESLEFLALLHVLLDLRAGHRVRQGDLGLGGQPLYDLLQTHERLRTPSEVSNGRKVVLLTDLTLLAHRWEVVDINLANPIKFTV